MKKALYTALIASLAVLTVSNYAFSDPIVGEDFNATISDVQLNGSDADFAYGGYSGNDSNTDLNALLSLAGANTVSLLAKDDIGSTSEDVENQYQGYEFSLSAASGSSGSFTFSWTKQDSNATDPLALDFFFGVKSNAAFALYQFSNTLIGSEVNPYNGYFSVIFTNKNDVFQDLSHLSVYGRLADVQPPVNPVPEPTTMLLVGTGLVGLAGSRFRKKKK